MPASILLSRVPILTSPTAKTLVPILLMLALVASRCVSPFLDPISTGNSCVTLKTVDNGSNESNYTNPSGGRNDTGRSDDDDAVAVAVAAAPAVWTPEEGVDPVYIQILEEAERRSDADFDSSHKRGDRGFVFGPTGGDFRHTLLALRNGRRTRNVLAGDADFKLALMTTPKHVEILGGCSAPGGGADDMEEPCRLWANGTLFDDIVLTKEGVYKGNDNHTLLDQGSSTYWLTALGGYIHAPYVRTLFLDSDAYPCPGVQSLFHLTDPSENFHKYWQMPLVATADFAAGVDQYAFGTGNDVSWTPGDPQTLKDFATFPERNTGTVLFNFHRKLGHTFAHFIPLVSEHVYNNVATKRMLVINDQKPFRIAHYLFHRLRPDFVDQQIPMHVSCRTYPGYKYAGTDGFLNGMYPIQSDGTPCSECRCTPCLINHQKVYDVKIAPGRMGWEDDRYYNSTEQ